MSCMSYNRNVNLLMQQVKSQMGLSEINVMFTQIQFTVVNPNVSVLMGAAAKYTRITTV